MSEMMTLRLAALLAGIRDVGTNPLLGVQGVQDGVTPQAGTNTGAGNQGTANTAQLQGQSGTSGTQTGLPRSLRFGRVT